MSDITRFSVKGSWYADENGYLVSHGDHFREVLKLKVKIERLVEAIREHREHCDHSLLPADEKLHAAIEGLEHD